MWLIYGNMLLFVRPPWRRGKQGDCLHVKTCKQALPGVRGY